MSKGKAATVAEVDAWIDAMPRRRSFRCALCSDKKSSKALDLIVSRIRERGERVARRDVLDILRSHFGFKGTDGGMRYHLEECRGIKWSELVK